MPGARRRPLALSLYSALTPLLASVAWKRVRRKLELGGTDPARFRERQGRATLARPDGPLIWFHAASVGESLSVLRLIAHMGTVDPTLHFLITSGTATSGAVLSHRLPPRTMHQFAPLDTRTAMRRFLAHWHPEAGIFVESELWPHMIEEAEPNDKGGLDLHKIDLIEISVVEEPADLGAKIGSVKDAAETFERIETLKDAETCLRDACGFSRSAAKALISQIKTVCLRDAGAEGRSEDVTAKALEQIETWRIKQALNFLNHRGA